MTTKHAEKLIKLVDRIAQLVLVHSDGGTSLLARRDALYTSAERFEEACSIIATYRDGSIWVLKASNTWQFSDLT